LTVTLPALQLLAWLAGMLLGVQVRMLWVRVRVLNLRGLRKGMLTAQLKQLQLQVLGSWLLLAQAG
jgi:hypothetical protein